MTRVVYEEYLQTGEWQSKADAAKERAGYICQSCGNCGALHAHHRTYERLGCELPEDIEVLCPACHGARHAKTPTQFKPIERRLRAHGIVPRNELAPGSNPWLAYSKAKALFRNYFESRVEYDNAIHWVTSYLGV